MITTDSQASLALLTDLYQLTMAYGYWSRAKAEDTAVFHLFFRRSPFRGEYLVTAGLKPVVDFLSTFRFDADDLAFLETIEGNDGKPLFSMDFLGYLNTMKLSVDVDAVPEGTVMFPHEPLLRISGPILQCQLLETALLNIINFQSLIATKASRICRAAKGQPVLEFGLRRAQGIDGALAASRAAYIGGCAATSNVLAGKRFGIPVKGTHAHSWVMSFDDELTAFREYAAAMPNNCVFLVDTYDTIDGVRHAIQVGKHLKEAGHKMVGIRLDSGDLASLSITARQMLDEAGFADAAIVASNDLDERLIESLQAQGSQINIWGVGTKLVTAYDQPALGGVYKLGAIRKAPAENSTVIEDWQPRLKLSEQPIKTSTPGILQVRRFRDAHGFFSGDMIWNLLQPVANDVTIVDLANPTRSHRMNAQDSGEDLLQPVLRNGQVVADLPSLDEARSRAQRELQQLHPPVLRFDNPERYRVGLEGSLHDLKARMIAEATP
ncbi:MAG: nicotinate phosphoribosyltransferase [Planctomycetaceae bacterium]|nr:nicotinate phosphoribosyltransferase [Planctomycetaceae bacterium]